MSSEKVMQILLAFQKAHKYGDHSEINKYSLKDLNQAKNELIRDKDSPHYQLILDKISEIKKKEERRYDYIKGIIVGLVVGIIGGISVSILSQYILRLVFK